MNFVRTLFRRQQRRDPSKEDSAATAQQQNNHPSSEQAVVVGAQTKLPKKKQKQRAQQQQQQARDDVADAAGATPTSTRSLTSNEQVVAEHLRLTNQHDLPGLFTGFTDNGDAIFIDTPMTPQSFVDEMVKICRSFLDFTLRIVDGIVEQPDGTVVVQLLGTGTHTGAPYSFGPYPEIPPTGIAVKLDREICRYHIREEDGKISKIVIMPQGELTGPPGLYTLIGGLIF